MWFRSLVAVSIGALLLTLYRIRVRQVSRALSVRFEERLAERTRIARDLHDTLLQTVQASKMIADDALEDTTDPARGEAPYSGYQNGSVRRCTREGQR